MARAIKTDFLQAFRFHVGIATGDNGVTSGDIFQFSRTTDDQTVAGFQQVTMPDVTIDASEYREGYYRFTRKYPGIPTFGEVSMMRGIALGDSDFWDWAVKAWDGGEYRVDLVVYHYTREEFKNLIAPTTEKMGDSLRQYKLHECFPTSCKTAADFDSTSGEVSIAEIGLACEFTSLKRGSSASEIFSDGGVASPASGAPVG